MAPADRLLERGLQRVRRRWFRLVALSVGWRVALAAALALSAVGVINWLVHPASARLLIAGAGALVATVASALIVAWPYRRRPGDRRVARFVEERCPECEDEIVAAVDIADRDAPEGFAALVVERAAARLQDVDPARIVSPEEMRSGVLRVLAAGSALVVAAVFTMPLLVGAMADARGRQRIAAGTDREKASAPAPRVVGIDLHYEYPRFTALAPRDETGGGDIYAPAGTRVRLRVHADRSIATARVAVGPNLLPATRVDARTFESSITLARDGSYRASVEDAGGLRGQSVEYFIRLVTDRPPEIHIVRPAGDQEITPLEEVMIEARADDDFGIASMEMVFAVAGGPEHVVPFQSIRGTETARSGARLLAAEDLGVKPGDVISYYARARDVARAKPSTLSRSEIYFLEVTPFNEEYSLADSQAMAAATGTELAGLIAAEKEVISATWNLQRRSGAGTSSEDAHAVAAAQAEVKARTEQAAGGAQPSRRGSGGLLFQFSGRLPQAGTSSNVSDAAAAMGRAVEQLQAGSTKGAISPEMAALTALLKAQAEIRQREIAQQRNGASSFGNGRRGQDLSNLFDRELRREQRTNYEPGSRVEQQSASTNPASALDGIRDLARRQEELARRQQGSGALPEDERRRELERLAREQEQLQRELEQSARQQGQTATSQAGGRSGRDAQTTMRRALEQMQRASADLQRRDPARAAASAAAAAAQLRQAEAQLQNGPRESGAPNGETRKLAEALDSLRQARDQLSALQRRMGELQRGDGSRGQQATKDAGELQRGGGSRGQQATKDAVDLQRTQQEYARAVQRAQSLVGALPPSGRDSGSAAPTPEQHEWSWGAPGTEAWKQDFSRWEALGADVSRALERSEASVARRLSTALSRDRLRAGASERVPDAYADSVARYYESLAKVKRQ